VLDIVARHRAKGLPSPINGEVLGRAGVSKSLIPRTLYALQALDLIDDKGSPTDTLESLRLAPEADYKQRLAQWLTGTYADVLQFIDPETADEVAIRDAFRSYNPVAQQPRMVTLFIGLFAAAGVRPDKFTKQRQPRKRSTAPNAAPSEPLAPAANKPRQEIGSGSAQDGGHSKPPSGHSMTDLALEHKLVELMRNDDIGDEEKSAIWILIQYLTSKSKKMAADQK
tara:strand:- start:45553 stop:46230 length:678 start_codon:yes stop_codon:yes gene_type:complete